MPDPHVGQQVPVAGAVETERQAARLASARGNDPHPLVEPGGLAAGCQERDEVARGRPGRLGGLFGCDQRAPPAVDVDNVELTLASKVGFGIGVAGHDQRCAVRRPVDALDRPVAIGQLPRRREASGVLARLGIAGGRHVHHEQVRAAPVQVAGAVALVVESPCRSRHRRPPDLARELGRSRVLHHPLRLREDSRQERDPAAIRRPAKGRDPIRHVGQPRGRPTVRGCDEQLVPSAAAGEEGQRRAIGRPMRGMTAPVRPGDHDRLRGGVGTLDDDRAAVLPRLGVRPADLVSDPLTVGAESDVVDPAEPVEVLRLDRRRHRSGHRTKEDDFPPHPDPPPRGGREWEDDFPPDPPPRGGRE